MLSIEPASNREIAQELFIRVSQKMNDPVCHCEERSILKVRRKHIFTTIKHLRQILHCVQNDEGHFVSWSSLTENTVKSHITHILNRLNLKNRAQVAIYANLILA